jgi:hypothetical protein
MKFWAPEFWADAFWAPEFWGWGATQPVPQDQPQNYYGSGKHRRRRQAADTAAEDLDEIVRRHWDLLEARRAAELERRAAPAEGPVVEAPRAVPAQAVDEADAEPFELALRGTDVEEIVTRTIARRELHRIADAAEREAKLRAAIEEVQEAETVALLAAVALIDDN